MEQNQVTICKVLFQSPFVILNRPELQEGFFQMLKNILAPRYKIISITTFMIIVPIIIYVILCINSGQFLKLPMFILEPYILNTFTLKQFQFYRLYSCLVVQTSLNFLLINALLLLIFGSLSEDIYGWKILIVYIGLPGLVGAHAGIIFIIMGLFYSYLIIEWSNPANMLMLRKIQIIIYIVGAVLFFLLMLIIENPTRTAIYSGTIYGALYGFIIGPRGQETQGKSFRKLGKFYATCIIIAISTILIIMIVFQQKTLV